MAVYTQISPAELDEFLANYGIGAAERLTGIEEGVENSNYLLETKRDRFILTLFEKRVHSDDLPFFLSLMDFLARSGIACPVPVYANDGKALRKLCDRWAIIVTFLPGRPAPRIDPGICAKVGAMMARLHQAGQPFPNGRRNDLSVTDWPVLLERCQDVCGAEQAELISELWRALYQITERWPIDLPVGVIHADLFPDNLFFQDDRVTGIIDFYFACHDILAYDLAVGLNAWCRRRDGSCDSALMLAFCRGYEDIRPLQNSEREAMGWLMAGAALRFALTRLYDWVGAPVGALVRPKDPMEYVRVLRAALTETPVRYG